jgi:hypothetical protein
MRTVLKWTFITIAALAVASFPTILSSHDVALGLPFTWYTRREIVTFGAQPNDVNLLKLLLDISLVLLGTNLLITLVRRIANRKDTNAA